MTTFEEQAAEFSQRPVTLVDVDIPFCSLRYSVGICAPDSRELFAIEGDSGWIPSADVVVLDDDTFALSGVRSLRIDKTGGTEAFALAHRLDLEETGDLTGRRLRVAFNVKASLLAVVVAPGLLVRLGDDFSNFRDWNLPVASIVAGLNLFEFDFDSPDAVVGAPTAEPVLQQFGAFLAAVGSSYTDGLSVDDFILLSLNPQAFPCYNVRVTCRDPAHFATQKEEKTLRFSGQEAPIVVGADGPTIMQAIRSRGIKLIPTKIDRERGYGRRDNIQVSFTDFLDDDRLVDPYFSIRSEKPESTFFRKFMARNPFLKGHPLILREGIGIDDPVTGNVRINLSEFKTRRYIIDRINGPNKQGVITFIAKDVLKQLDNQQIPSPSEADTADPIDLVQTTLTLTAGSVANLVAQFALANFTLPNGQFYIRIDDEVMLVLLDPTGGDILETVRAQLGSTLEEHEVDSKVQLVQSWFELRVDNIWNDIQIQSKIDPSLIALADAQTETEIFLAEFILTAHITEPTKSSLIMRDLNLQCGTNTWWDTEDQVTRLKPTRPPIPGETLRTFSDEETIVGGSVDITRREETRITNAFVYFDIINWAADLDKPGNFRKAVLFIDADAESEDQYNDQKSRKFFSYFLPSNLASVARSIAARYVAAFRDPTKAITLRATTKDAAFVKPGDLVDLRTFGLVDFDGRVRPELTFVISKKRVNSEGIQWEYGLESSEFGGLKFGFWCEDTVPDHAVATEQQKRECAFWAGTDCLLPDGSAPYSWV